MTDHLSGGVVVFSGGSAANSLVDVFNTVCETKGCSLTYIIPISDNGGSSSELIRVFGGPGIGDIRSRLVRLIPTGNGDDVERRALKTFFNHRLPSESTAAKSQWLEIVEARHELWNGISAARKELIRSFLNFLNLEIVKRARPSSVFNFDSASIGNMFLTGARLFTGSFESAIYLLSSICDIPDNISVLPAMNTNFTCHICAGLANGETIYGQNSISHPSSTVVVPTPLGRTPLDTPPVDGTYNPWEAEAAVEHADKIEDANLPGSLPTLRTQNIKFSKAALASEELLAPISRIWYINPYGQEIRPPPNPRIVEAAANAQCIIYSIGSLFTSTVPSLILKGVGGAIATGKTRANRDNNLSPSSLLPDRTNKDTRLKILILNGSIDRETSSVSGGQFTAMGFVEALAKAALESRGIFKEKPDLGEIGNYVNHIICIEGEGAPKIDKNELAMAGIEVTRVYGRRVDEGCRYDEKALTQALEALVGRKYLRANSSRRNTMER